MPVMAAFTQLHSVVLNPLLPISSLSPLREANKLSLPTPASFSAASVLRTHLHSPPFCRLQPAGASDEAPPSSRDEALSQARASLASFLEKALRNIGPSTVKQRKLQRQARLRVEMPLLEESDSNCASLLIDLFSTLSIVKRGTPVSFSVFCNPDIMEKLRTQKNLNSVENPSFRCCNISETSIEFEDTQVVVILSPKLSELTYMVNIAKAADPRPVVLLNPDWSSEQEESDTPHASFLQSFQVVYSYLPLVIQGFFSKTEGAVLKHVKSGAPAGRPWLIFVKEGEMMKCTCSVNKRPTAVDLENALYNAMAANSPVTKSIKFLKGILAKT